LKTLGFDLAWSGTTGWAVYDDAKGKFTHWGDFTPTRVSGPKSARKTRRQAKNLHRCLEEVFRLANNVVLVGYEAKDWNDPKQIKSQKRLYQAEMVLIQMTDIYDILEIGANEAKRKFEAKDKQEAARLIAIQWPEEFTFQKPGTGWLMDKWGHPLSHDVSDAMVIAYVASRMWNFQKMVKEVDSG